MIRKVLVAIHRNEPLGLMEITSQLAQVTGAQVMLFHAMRPTAVRNPEAGVFNDGAVETAEEARELLHRAAQQLAPGIPREERIVTADAATAIIETAKSWGADVVVMGNRRHGRMVQLLMGRTLQPVLDRAPCPVLTAGPKFKSLAAVLENEPSVGDAHPNPAAESSVSPEKREKILEALHRIVCNSVRETLAGALPGDSPEREQELAQQVDSLVAIARRTPTPKIEAYWAQMLEEICTHCPHEDNSRFCALRHDHQCVLFQSTQPIMSAITEAISEKN